MKARLVAGLGFEPIKKARLYWLKTILTHKETHKI